MTSSPQFYDIVDENGVVIETAEEQATKYVEGGERKSAVITPNVEIDHEQKKVTVTPGDIKKINKMYITSEHPKVAACLHRLDLNRQPVHRNCEGCWFAFFQNHGELVQQLDEMYTAGKADEIIVLQGIKFYKRWRQFMSTIAQWKETMEENERTN